MRILLIEPDMVLARQISRAITRAGHKVDWARSGQGGVDLADDNTPGAVILELNLSQHNGVEFLYEFRSHADWHPIPVIIYSNLAHTDIQASPSAWESLGIRHYFFKPEVSLGQLVDAISWLPALKA